ncbi:hemerythrin [Sporanaerobium hydrogeniformans]|uniref:Hemerythrin n=1 Tax=Sporanaerobium hydrogeniformans TaxID=3072179 RepID=A0AC61DAN2_9FIRM|nr:hemerythrin domain-containing protein [Sporanaerobium hydrogeniformans]PHV70077.1 hemerythrin [Sporanaerobium hydrogeniformans]
MNSIDIMMEEHKYICRMLKVVRKVCWRILKGEEPCFEDFYKIIDFIKNYADAHHHGKEEKFLFQAMTDHLGELGSKLVRNGMLVEHDLGRLYIKELTEALERVKNGDEESKLDVLANAISYTHLLERHIAKEDEVVYTFGMRQLPNEILEQVHHQSAQFEKEAQLKEIQNNYIGLLKELEGKYLD